MKTKRGKNDRWMIYPDIYERSKTKESVVEGEYFKRLTAEKEERKRYKLCFANALLLSSNCDLLHAFFVSLLMLMLNYMLNYMPMPMLMLLLLLQLLQLL